MPGVFGKVMLVHEGGRDGMVRQMQRRIGLQSGMFFSSKVSLLQRILREEGVKAESTALEDLAKMCGMHCQGLYRGVVVNVQRAALVNLGESRA